MSAVDICNGALGLLGQGTITDLKEGGTKASLCERRYPVARDAVLQMHPWNFALARAALPASSDAPPFGFQAAFPLPTDCLQVLALHDAGLGEPWAVEGRRILVDRTGPLRIRYIARITDTALFPPLFREGLELWMAAQMASALTDGQSRRDALFRQFRTLLAEARATDAQEGQAPRIEGSAWLSARGSA